MKAGVAMLILVEGRTTCLENNIILREKTKNTHQEQTKKLLQMYHGDKFVSIW